MQSPHGPTGPDDRTDVFTTPAATDIEHYVEDRLHRLPLEDLDEIARRLAGAVHDGGGHIPL